MNNQGKWRTGLDSLGSGLLAVMGRPALRRTRAANANKKAKESKVVTNNTNHAETVGEGIMRKRTAGTTTKAARARKAKDNIDESTLLLMAALLRARTAV